MKKLMGFLVLWLLIIYDEREECREKDCSFWTTIVLFNTMYG